MIAGNTNKNMMSRLFQNAWDVSNLWPYKDMVKIIRNCRIWGSISLRFNHNWKVKPDKPSPVALASHAQCAVGMLQLDWPVDQNRPCPKDPQIQIEQPGQLLLGFSDLWNSDLWNLKLKLHPTRIYKDREGQPIRNSSVLWRLSSSLGAGPQPPATKNWPRMALSTGGPTIHCLVMRIPHSAVS